MDLTGKKVKVHIVEERQKNRLKKRQIKIEKDRKIV